jgi:metallo-beta-lactamase family protein
MVVASNGMITGGRIVQHVKALVGDPGMTLLFVGYQGDSTLGAHLQEGAKQVRIDGQDLEVPIARCVRSADSPHTPTSQSSSPGSATSPRSRVRRSSCTATQ